MNLLKWKYLSVVVLTMAIRTSFAQTADTATVVPIFTADSLASGNYKDILSSFFQLAADNLTGPNKELKFTANPYAIMLKNDSTLKEYSQYKRYQLWRRFNLTLDARLDSAYHFNGFATGLTYALVNRRDFSLSGDFIKKATEAKNDAMFGRAMVVLDSLRQIPSEFISLDTIFLKEGLAASGIDGAAGKALLEAYRRKERRLIYLTLERTNSLRDIDGSDTLNIEEKKKQMQEVGALFQGRIDKEIGDIRDSAGNGIDIGAVGKFYSAFQESLHAQQMAFMKEIRQLFNDSTLTFDKVDPILVSWIFKDTIHSDTSIRYIRKLLTADPKLIVAIKSREDFKKLIAGYAVKGLWIIGVNDTSYADGGLFRSVQLYSEYLNGFLRPTDFSMLEVDLRAYANFNVDTLVGGRNLRRQLWTAEPGVNWVFKGKKTGIPFFEFKLSGGISHVFKGYYADDKNLNVTLNATVRLRILNELWVPVQIKYDPDHGKFLGFLNITTNFTGLSSMIKGGSGKRGSQNNM